MQKDIDIRKSVNLSSLTTLAVGGPARFFCECASEEQVVAALDWAREQGVPVFVLGGGSNVLAADEGFDGLVLRLSPPPSSAFHLHGETIKAGAGAVWDDVAAFAAAHSLWGIECLSGIPGRVGATPIQNVGAYGQEVSQTIEEIWAIDMVTRQRVLLSAKDCGFAYRHSHFKDIWRGKYIITAVSCRLSKTPRHPIRHGEVSAYLAEQGKTAPSSADVRAAVLAVRQRKSMVLDDNDPNRRSAGSFFLNPLIPTADIIRVRGLIAASRTTDRPMPEFPVGGGIKIPAAWLIEETGLKPGFQLGRAALSTRHTLSIVNLGEANAADILQLAAFVRETVRGKFGVTLSPEPVFLGLHQAF